MTKKKAGMTKKKAGMIKKKVGMAIDLQAQENPDIRCATACSRQLPIVRKNRWVCSPRSTFKAARCLTDA
jgi:hypothetical protein